MTWAYDKPYPGGKMVGPAFPRNLYPPDAKPGHTPSIDGPDVLALKRALWRGGRWPGPASSHDDTYSNAVAHGKTGGMVGSSGTAGFQRQQRISPPTGWLGAGPNQTGNAIRSARIPAGLPHAGEPLLDAYAIELLAEAVEMFGQSSDRLVRDQALAEAKKWIGTTESPYGSNEVLFSDWYGMTGPWCFMFCTYCFELAASSLGKDSPTFVRGSYYAYCPYGVDDALNGRRGLTAIAGPEPNCLVFYDFEGDGLYDHVGLVEAASIDGWTAIEGNTSPEGGTGSQSNGGGVYRRSRDPWSANSVVFARVAEP